MANVVELKPKQRLEQMLDFISADLKNRKFDFRKIYGEKNRFVATKGDNKYGMILLNYPIPELEFRKIHISNLRNFGTNYNIFYKDGKTFFKKMVDSNAFRKDKSLKLYTSEQIKEIISLTIQERNALFNFNSHLVEKFSPHSLSGKSLIYYQPELADFSESIAKFEVLPVELVYSHLEEDHPGYGKAKDGISKTYFFMVPKN